MVGCYHFFRLLFNCNGLIAYLTIYSEETFYNIPNDIFTTIAAMDFNYIISFGIISLRVHLGVCEQETHTFNFNFQVEYC